jgi:1-acyl-sn-glycerol-3-phosphate acyltransferase
MTRFIETKLSDLDPINLWAEVTDREIHQQPFQRDVRFLRRLLRGMELMSRYFDAEVRGLEHVPRKGAVLLVGNHSGGVLTPDTTAFFAAWYRERGLDSPLIGLALDAAFGIPWFRDLMRKIGEVPASRENAGRALDAGLPVLVYPGGDHEVFRPWSERNRIDFGGRKGFIELALRMQVPVVPVVGHGGHATTIILTRGEWIGRRLGMGRIRTTTFPLALQIPWGLSVAALPGFPLPAKITMQVCPPMPWESYGPKAADDPSLVRRLYHEVTDLMQATLDRLAAEHPYPVLSRLASLLPFGAAGNHAPALPTRAPRHGRRRGTKPRGRIGRGGTRRKGR